MRMWWPPNRAREVASMRPDHGACQRKETPGVQENGLTSRSSTNDHDVILIALDFSVVRRIVMHVYQTKRNKPVSQSSRDKGEGEDVSS